MSTSDNTPNLQCDLCWETFPTSAELADHIDQEEWTLSSTRRAEDAKVVLSWDYKAQVPLDRLAQAVSEASGGKVSITEVDTGGGEGDAETLLALGMDHGTTPGGLVLPPVQASGGVMATSPTRREGTMSTKRYLLEGLQPCTPIWDQLHPPEFHDEASWTGDGDGHDGLWEVEDSDDPEYAVVQAFKEAYPNRHPGAKPYRQLRVSEGPAVFEYVRVS